MKRIIFPLVTLMASVLLCSSCLNSDDDYVYNDDAAITAFTLGNINQTFHCKTKDGLRDSSYVKSVDYSDAVINIDHLKAQIFNTDSLPYGVDLTKVLATVSTRNSGSVGLKNVDSDTLKLFTSTDSVDYTKPRQLYVYSNSGKTTRVYTVTLLAHQQDGDKFAWTRLDGNNTQAAGISALKDMRLVALGGKRLLLAGTDGHATRLFTSDDGKTWSETTTAETLDADAYAHIASDGQQAWMCSAGQLYTTTDGTLWAHTPAPAIKHMVAVCGTQLFAYSQEGALTRSTDNGASWTAEPVDTDDDAFLPTQHMAAAVSAVGTNKGVYRIVMAGSRDNNAYAADTADVVWSKIIDADSDQQQWTCHYGADSYATYRLPRLANMQMASGKWGLVAFGGKGVGACDKPAQQCFWNSADNGMTWKPDTIATLPEGFSTNAEACAFTIDADNYVWLVCGATAQVWRGRLNKLGWATRQDIFEYRKDEQQ